MIDFSSNANLLILHSLSVESKLLLSYVSREFYGSPLLTYINGIRLHKEFRFDRESVENCQVNNSLQCDTFTVYSDVSNICKEFTIVFT